MYCETVEVTGVTTTPNFYVVPLTLHLELLNRSRIIRGVLGTYNANDTMLRRSAQLLLAAENHHFEGKALQSGREHSERRCILEHHRTIGSKKQGSNNRIRLQVHATFKVIVLRRQEELVGPPQHSIIRNTCSHDSPAIFRAIEQL